jgi:RNA polymerase sigma factor for flagellar operon FliA
MELDLESAGGIFPLKTVLPNQDVSTVSGSMASEELALWIALRENGDATARVSLMEMHLPYARVVAATYYARRTHNEVEFADYLQLARVGLVESVDRFDHTLGVQFRTFAARRMHGSILNGLERSTEKSQQIAVRKRVQRERLSAAKLNAQERTKAQGASGPAELFEYLAEVSVGLAIGVLLEGSGMVDADAFGESQQASTEEAYLKRMELRRLQEVVLGEVAKLSQQEQVVVRRHYLQDHPFEQIATHLGLTKGRISQVHKAALKKLRESLQQQPPKDFWL